MICATARRHNLGQIKPTPLAASRLGEARSPQLEASQQLHDANCTFCPRKVKSEEKHQCVTQISSFRHKAMQLPVHATLRENF